MNKKTGYILTTSISIILIATAIFENKDTLTVIGVLVLPLASAAYLAAWLLKNPSLVKKCHFIFSFGALVALEISYLQTVFDSPFQRDYELYIDKIAFSWCGASMVAFIIVIPTQILPMFWRSRRSKNISMEPEFNVVQESFIAIRQQFKDVETSVKSETAKLLSAMEQMERSMRLQDSRLRKAVDDAKAARDDAEQYKQIASLTKAQQAAFMKMLGRSKYIDYIVGFVLGVVGSVLVEAAKELQIFWK